MVFCSSGYIEYRSFWGEEPTQIRAFPSHGSEREHTESKFTSNDIATRAASVDMNRMGVPLMITMESTLGSDDHASAQGTASTNVHCSTAITHERFVREDGTDRSNSIHTHQHITCTQNHTPLTVTRPMLGNEATCKKNIRTYTSTARNTHTNAHTHLALIEACAASAGISIWWADTRHPSPRTPAQTLCRSACPRAHSRCCQQCETRKCQWGACLRRQGMMKSCCTTGRFTWFSHGPLKASLRRED